MDVLDALRTTIALVVGYLVSVVGIGLLAGSSPGGIVVPVSIGLGAGVLATIAVRTLLRTTNYAMLSGTILFTLVGAAMLAQGSEAPMAPEHARLLLYLAGAGLVLNEILVRTGELVAAGGIEQSDRHRIWAVPAAVVGVVIIAARQFDLEGLGRPLALLASAVALGAHVAVASLGVEVLAEPILGLAFCGLFVLFPVTSPQRVVDGTGEGTVTGAVTTGIVGASRRVLAGFRRLDTLAALSVRRLRATLVTMRTSLEAMTVPGIRASAATADGGSAGTVIGGSGKTGSNRGSVGDRSDATSGRSERASSDATTGSTSGRTDDTSTDGPTRGQDDGATHDRSGNSTSRSRSNSSAGPGSGPSERSRDGEGRTGGAQSDAGRSSPSACRNCGKDRSTVRLRPIVETDSPRATGTVGLCACCHAARRCDDVSWDCGTAVPVPRDQVLERSDGQCLACGRGPADVLELHPVVPLESRGHCHQFNVAPLCPSCHASVHDD